MIKNNILYLDAESIGNEVCFCDCCFGLVYQVKGISNKDISVNFHGKPVELNLEKPASYPKRFVVTTGDTIYFVTKVQPEFPGGFDASKDFISRHLLYPADAIKEKFEGRVFV